METWNLLTIDSPLGTRDPHVIHQDEGARGVLLVIQAGQEIGEHSVRENTWAIVLDGAISVSPADGEESSQLARGSLVYWRAREHRTISAREGARVLLVLTPWPGEGHYTEAELESQVASGSMRR